MRFPSIGSAPSSPSRHRGIPDKRVRNVLLVLALLISASFAAAETPDPSGTWRVVYDVLLVAGRAPIVYAPSATTVPIPILRVTFGPDGMGELVFDGELRARVFWNIEQAPRGAVDPSGYSYVRIQPQGSQEMQWYWTLMADGRAIVSWYSSSRSFVILERVP